MRRRELNRAYEVHCTTGLRNIRPWEYVGILSVREMRRELNSVWSTLYYRTGKHQSLRICRYTVCERNEETWTEQRVWITLNYRTGKHQPSSGPVCITSLQLWRRMNGHSAVPWQGSARQTWTRIARESLYNPVAILSRDRDLLTRVPYQLRSPRTLQIVARGQTEPSIMLIGVKMLFAKLRKVITFVMSVCLYAWNNSAPTGRIFVKFGSWKLFESL
jgi:hypothetical protein